MQLRGCCYRRYYGQKLMQQADQDKRISNVPRADRAGLYGVGLGRARPMAIWFAQVVGREIRLIDYYEANGVDLGHYVREIMSKPYLYADHIVPHDAQAKNWGRARAASKCWKASALKA